MISETTRLHRALEGEKVDRPPCICPGGMMNMITKGILNAEKISFINAHHNSELMSRLAKQVYQSSCFENLGVPFCMTIEAEAFGATVDYGKDDIEPHVTKYCLKDVFDWKKLKTPNHNENRSKVVLDAIKGLKNDNLGVPIIGNITGPMSTVTSMIEPVVFYKALSKNKIDAHKMLQIITDSLISFAVMQIDAGADIISISDPSGTGEILGPKLFESFVVPYINQITTAVHKKNKQTIVHICGKMDKVYKQVDKINSNALSFDALVNMPKTIEALKNHNIMGNISTYTLEFGTPDTIRKMTKKCIKQGVNIIAPACGLGMKSPLENIQAMLVATKGEINGNH